MTKFSLEQKECLLCGNCLQVCPVFRVTDREELSPRAKGFLLQEFLKNNFELQEENVRKLTGLCLNCGRCREVCPQDLDIPADLARLKSRSPGWEGFVWKEFIKFLPVIFPLLSQWQGSLYLLRLKKDLSFLDRKNALENWLDIKVTKKELPENIAAVFPGCLARYARVDWKEKAEKIIKESGYRLIKDPDWKCCGYTLGQAGLLTEKRKMQEHNLSLWRKMGRPEIMVFCVTCLLGLKMMAEEELGWQAGERDLWLNSLNSVSGLLDRAELQLKDIPPAKIYLHQACHSANTEWHNLWTGLTSLGLDVQVVDECCGLGGVLKLENKELSSLVRERFWQKISDDPSVQVLSNCSGCLLQLSSKKPQRVNLGHWLEILDLS